MEDGVWRTVGGRRIFIKNGQDLASAMKESGKFQKEELTNDEKELLDYAVKEAGIMEYNDIMRNNYTGVPEELYNQMDKLDDIISKNKIEDNMELYRYITNKEVFDNLEINDVYEDKAFISTTKNANSDREDTFKNDNETYNVKMVINATKGNNAFDISNIYDKEAKNGLSESEVLFGRNTKLKLTKKDVILDPTERRILLSNANEKEKKLFDNQWNNKKYIYYFDVEN